MDTRRRATSQEKNCRTKVIGTVWETVVAIKRLVEWPPRSPDLNPLHFFVGIPQIQSVCHATGKPRRTSSKEVTTGSSSDINTEDLSSIYVFAYNAHVYVYSYEKGHL